MKNQVRSKEPVAAVAATVVLEPTSNVAATAEIAAPKAEETESPAQKARRERAEAMKINKPVEEITTDQNDSVPAIATKRVRTPSVSNKPNVEFVLDLALQTELRALSAGEIVAKALEAKVLRSVDAENQTVFGLGASVDFFHGQPVQRSSVRGAIYDYVDSCKDRRATMAQICAYMELGRARLFKGKFNAGYVSTSRSEDSKRGMVARRQLVIISRPARAVPEEVKTIAAPTAEPEPAVA